MSSTELFSDQVLQEELNREIKRVLPGAVAMRRTLHSEPELSWQEEKTAIKVAQKLRELEGVEVETGVGRLGVVGILDGKAEGPTIALRADMDALPITEQTGLPYASKIPGVQHACGHDGHMANLLASAEVLSRMRDRIRGKIKFIFQPAEEGGAGALAMIKDGVLRNPPVDCIYGLHGWPPNPCGQITTIDGPLLASTVSFLLEVEGRSGHAAMPSEAIDPIMISAKIIDALQIIVSRQSRPQDPLVISCTSIQGGTSDNIIPQSVKIRGTIRALSSETRDWAIEQVGLVAERTAGSFGGNAEAQFTLGYPVTENHPKVARHVLEMAEKLFPKGHSKREPQPSMGGEDFSYYLREVAGCFFFVGLSEPGKPGVSLHNHCFDFNDAALEYAIKMFVSLSLSTPDVI